MRHDHGQTPWDGADAQSLDVLLDAQLTVVRVFPLDLDEAPAPAAPVLAGAPLGRFEHITLGRVGLHGEDVLAPLVQATVPPLGFQYSDGARSYDRPLDLYQRPDVATP